MTTPYDKLAMTLTDEGHDFFDVDRTLEALAEEYKMLDEFGEMKRGFSASQAAEARRRLEAADA